MHHRTVQPCRPPAPYIGGKRNLARLLANRIEAVDHETYAEPFVGMGGVFLARRRAAPVELVNDRSRDVVTLFRVLQRHYAAFMDVLRFQLTSRTDFERLTRTDVETLTDLERAARFLYLQRTAFGGKVAGRSFGVSLSSGARFDVGRLGEVLAAVHERIASVTIENLDFGEFLARYDRPATLFYLDPPYHGTEHYYGLGAFERADFRRLAEQLRALAGSFILSINDVPEIREAFAGFAIEPVTVTHMVGGGDDAKPTAELIISRIRRMREGGLF